MEYTLASTELNLAEAHSGTWLSCTGTCAWRNWTFVSLLCLKRSSPSRYPFSFLVVSIMMHVIWIKKKQYKILLLARNKIIVILQVENKLYETANVCAFILELGKDMNNLVLLSPYKYDIFLLEPKSWSSQACKLLCCYPSISAPTYIEDIICAKEDGSKTKYIFSVPNQLAENLDWWQYVHSWQ
jgi:hypothetical protein